MNVPQFQAKWRNPTLTERAAAQEHFIDLCRLLGMPTPAEADRAGAFYTFEKRVRTIGGGTGYADVWYKKRFAWEYKKDKADLDAAYQQLLRYREDLENPPLLVVCDLTRFVVHTNFTGTAKRVYEFTVEDLDQAEPLAILRALWTEPHRLRPEHTVEAVTEEAAARFGQIALGLRDRGVEPHRAAHFVVQLLFCLFAEDVGLLPKGLFGELLRFSATRPAQFPAQAETLLRAMRDGGVFALKEIDRFNGGLFEEIGVEALTGKELGSLAEAATLDWSSVEPAIFGTLFERSLDPAKRAQLGAHYTGRADIERVVEPVVLAPLRRRWDAVRAAADALKARWDEASPTTRNRRREAFARQLFAFQEELAAVRVLDPACGSGNFLYVALAGLKDLEKAVIAYGAANGLPMMLPRVGPRQLYGLEINEYAVELAQVVVWIGYLQWMRENGFQVNRDPVLEPLDTIRLQDALLDRSDPEKPKEAVWPEADLVVGNPPFLGGNRIRQELGDEYLKDLWSVYDERVPRFADLVCYFFERARFEIEQRRTLRAGLLATNSIRGGVNREVLHRIKGTGDIFLAWSDEPWILEGAAVRISIIGFDDGTETGRCLDGEPAASINADLTKSIDITSARRLPENGGIAYMGTSKKGPFEISGELARSFLSMPVNPNGKRNADVVKRWYNGKALNARWQDEWIIDFGARMTEEQASLYEAPFEYVKRTVKAIRDRNNRAAYRDRWWLLAEPRPALRDALGEKSRYIATTIHAKYRLFSWVDVAVVPDQALIVFARDDDYFFGVLHSRAHEVWSLRMGTWLGKGNDPRYTPTTCFETFPFPRLTDEQREAIAAAAKLLDERRSAWLNPPDADPAELKKRTLTNLYNQRPTWLANLHAELDRAVWAAYGWEDEDPATVEEDVILARLLALNLERAGE